MQKQDFKDGDKVIFSANFGNCTDLVGKVCTGDFRTKFGTYFYVVVEEDTQCVGAGAHFAWGEITNINHA